MTDHLTIGGEVDRLLDAYLGQLHPLQISEGEVLDAVRGLADHGWSVFGSRAGMAALRVGAIGHLRRLGFDAVDATGIVDAVYDDLRDFLRPMAKIARAA